MLPQCSLTSKISMIRSKKSTHYAMKTSTPTTSIVPMLNRSEKIDSITCLANLTTISLKLREKSWTSSRRRGLTLTLKISEISIMMRGRTFSTTRTENLLVQTAAHKTRQETGQSVVMVCAVDGQKPAVKIHSKSKIWMEFFTIE